MPQVDREKVLAENARWQAELIEAFGICPYARRCREENRMMRDVLDATDADLPEVLTAALVGLHRQPLRAEKQWEIALILCPAVTLDAGHFERLVRQSSDQAVAQVRNEGVDPQFVAVAFHPQLAYAPTDPYKLLGFWRRSPHPTVQLVHLPTLNRLSSAHIPPKYVDPDDLTSVRALLGQDISGDLADRIALANWRTYHARTEELLAKSAQLLTSSNDS